VDDPLAGSLQAWACESGNDAAAFMRASGLFGDDLPENDAFTGRVQAWLALLDSGGIEAVLKKAVGKP
jgi:mannitol-1-phosphate/altronate dehydrogenase